MNSGFSKVAIREFLAMCCPGIREVLLTTPPIVNATVACRWGGRTIRPLNDTGLGLEVAEVMASTSGCRTVSAVSAVAGAFEAADAIGVMDALGVAETVEDSLSAVC